MTSRGKVVVVGLDGATFQLIKPWAAQGRLPTFASLLKEGAHGNLESTLHPLTAPAWSSFITGMNPGKHAVFDFTRRILGSYRMELVNAASRQATSLWRTLSESGRSVGVVNVPMTYPVEPVNGYLVAGIDTPDLSSPYTYPASLAEELSPDHLIAVSTSGKTIERYLEETLEAVMRRFRVVNHLLDRGQPDFFMKVVVETDAIQHCAWHLMDDSSDPLSSAILQVYQRVDALLGELVARLPKDTTLILMSDHGAGPIDKVVYLDTWLMGHGLLRYADLDRGLGKRLQDVFTAVARNGLQYAQRYLPQSFKGLLKRLAGVRSQVESFLSYGGFDWQATRAYPVGNQGSININLVGREPSGIVQPGHEYEQTRDEIISLLTELRDPETGETVVDRVYRREEVYDGPKVELAPDLLIRWKDDRYVAKVDIHPERGKVFGRSLKFGKYSSRFDFDQTGTHRMAGILALHGPDVKAGFEVSGATIVDLTPTILHLMGEPVPTSMDGRVLVGALTPDFLVQNPVRYTGEGEPPVSPGERPTLYGPEDERKIRERLQGLGYVT